MRRQLLLAALLATSCVEPGSLADAGDEPDMPRDMAAPTDMTAPDMAPPVVSCDPGMTACGLLCVDLMSDATSCGQCGRTCAASGVAVVCRAGECVPEVCEDPAGCGPVTAMCMAGQACQTSCGSPGMTACVDGVAQCMIGAETCDATDDDCDGQCDEGGMPGCRVGIHRGHQGGGHIFTDDMAQIENLEAANFFFLYQRAPAAAPVAFRPVFLCDKPNGKKLLSEDAGCGGAGTQLKQLGFWASAPTCGAAPLFHVYSDAAGNDFYTTSAPERDNAVGNLGYRDDGIAGYIWASP
jgi:hypothetical protein